MRRSAQAVGDEARALLHGRLEARRSEIEAAALTRVKAISDPGEVADPVYGAGLRAAVGAAIGYGLETTGSDGERIPPIPVVLLAQARLAARNGIPLDTVLRRYFAGYSLLGYFILEEAGNAGITDGRDLKRLLGAHAGLFDRLLAGVSEEHARETRALRVASDRKHVERIERLLAGELIDTSDIPYGFEGWHLGMVGGGREALETAREIAESLDLRLLPVERGKEAVAWAWLGSRQEPDPVRALELAASASSREMSMALGEPGQGLEGWRLSHRQAAAALGVAGRGEPGVVRYADVALAASAIKDDLLTVSLRRLYLDPLAKERDGGQTLRGTLRAYLAADGNLASAAAAVGVTPRTIRNRLRRAERLVGRPLRAARADLELALRLRELGPGD